MNPSISRWTAVFGLAVLGSSALSGAVNALITQAVGTATIR